MGEAKLKGKKRRAKPKGFSPVKQPQTVKVMGSSIRLLPDLGQSLLESGLPYHASIKPRRFIDGQFYREPNRLETSIDLPNHCATLVFPCETSGLAIQRMHFLKQDGFTGKLEPDESLAYTTPRTKERVVPLRAVPD